jgi:hypothetical protein
MEEKSPISQDALIVFIKSVLLKIENVEKLMAQDPPTHIPAYNKLLGINIKFEDLPRESKQWFFPQLVMTRGVITLFLNGRYTDGLKQLSTIKKDLIKIVKDLENV